MITANQAFVLLSQLFSVVCFLTFYEGNVGFCFAILACHIYVQSFIDTTKRLVLTGQTHPLLCGHPSPYGTSFALSVIINVLTVCALMIT